jgi:5-methylcytosine-specific restriction endonuclease McrA
MEGDETSVANEKIFGRDRYKCKNCGREGGDKGEVELHAHHIVPRSVGGKDRLSNLVTLCRECHKAIHIDGHQAPTIEYKGLDDYAEEFGSMPQNNNKTEDDGLSGPTNLDDFDEE